MQSRGVLVFLFASCLVFQTLAQNASESRQIVVSADTEFKIDGLISGLSGTIITLLDAVKSLVVGLTENLGGFLEGTLSVLTEVVANLFGGIKSGLLGLIQALGFLPLIGPPLEGLADTVKDCDLEYEGTVLEDGLQGIVTCLSDPLGVILAKLGDLIDNVKEIVAVLGTKENEIAEAEGIGEKLNKLLSILPDTLSQVGPTLDTVLGLVMEIVGSLPGLLVCNVQQIFGEFIGTNFANMQGFVTCVLG